MTLINNNFSVLPFYTSLDNQDYKKVYSYGVSKPVISRKQALPPFQIIRDHIDDQITRFDIVDSKGVVLDILPSMIEAGLKIIEYENKGYDVIMYASDFIFPKLILETGVYYAIISDGVNTWYSDVFKVVHDLSSYLKIEYYDSENIEFTGGHIDYTNDFKNFIYLESIISRPEYSYKEEVKDIDGYLFHEKQISEKIFNFGFFANESTCDALRVVRLHDFIKITDNFNSYNVDNFDFDVSWTDQSNLAEVLISFTADTLVKKIARGVPLLGGDYSDDYNNDFDN